jgi:hypothetical protein
MHNCLSVHDSVLSLHAVTLDAYTCLAAPIACVVAPLDECCHSSLIFPCTSLRNPFGFFCTLAFITVSLDCISLRCFLSSDCVSVHHCDLILYIQPFFNHPYVNNMPSANISNSIPIETAHEDMIHNTQLDYYGKQLIVCLSD